MTTEKHFEMQRFVYDYFEAYGINKKKTSILVFECNKVFSIALHSRRKVSAMMFDMFVDAVDIKFGGYTIQFLNKVPFVREIIDYDRKIDKESELTKWELTQSEEKEILQAIEESSKDSSVFNALKDLHDDIREDTNHVTLDNRPDNMQHSMQSDNLGMKYDTGKLPWELLPLSLIESIVEVQAYGAKKYKPNSWQHVPNAETRYYAALMRHIKQMQSGETHDSESGLLHISHIQCNAMYLQYFIQKRIAENGK